jgi:putative spermidine/putrescine transport system substrate-binding protein
MKTTQAPPTPSDMDLLISAAKSEGQLNVIALPHDWLNYGEIISTFSKKYGITVNERDPDIGSIEELEALRNSTSSGEQLAPDVVDISIPHAMQAKEEKLLQPYKVASWSSIPDSAKDIDGYWYGDYYGIYVFEVNPKFVSVVPQDWSDLLKPEYKITLPISATSPICYPTTMLVYSASLANGGTLDDIEPGIQFFQKIDKNGNLPNCFANGDQIASGETPIAFSLDYLALVDRQAHSNDGEIAIVVPKTGNIAVSFAQGINAYAPHPNAAKLWMEFLYSDEGQLLFLKGLGHPIRFADMFQRKIISNDLLESLLPSELFLNAIFPTGEQISSAYKLITANRNPSTP